MKKILFINIGFFMGTVISVCYLVHVSNKSKETYGIKGDKTCIQWSVKDTTITIRGDTLKAIKMLIKRLDYLENGQPLMRKTHELSKTQSL